MSKHDHPSGHEGLDEAYGRALENDEFAYDNPKPRRRFHFRGMGRRTQAIVIAGGLAAMIGSPFAVAATGDALREGRRNGTTTRETEIVGRINGTTALKGGYVTRQSNLSSSGGGAVYGCRSQAGGSAAKPTPQNPCIRANNLSRGSAFEFNSSLGESVGTITAGAGGDSKKPFTTNATGVATGLNADRVDGVEGKSITDGIAASLAAADSAKGRFVTVRQQDDDSGAEIVAQSGGFTLVNCYEANSNCYIDAGSDVTNRAITTTILTDNTVDPGGAAPEDLAGISSAAPCFADYVNCGPTGTDSGNGGSNGVFVVTPRNFDGTSPAAGDRYGFTATISGATANAAPNDDNYAD